MENWLSVIMQSESKTISWALDSNRIGMGQGAISGEQRLTLVLSILSSLSSNSRVQIQTSILDPVLSICLAAGILVQDLVSRSGKRSVPIINGDLLLITRQIGLGLAGISEVELEKTHIKDIWNVSSINLLSKFEKSSKPRIFVSSPNLEKVNKKSLNISTIIVDATHSLTIQRLDSLLNDDLFKTVKRMFVVSPIGVSIPNSKGPEWIKWVWDHEAIDHSRSYIKSSKQPENTKNHWNRTVCIVNDEKLCSFLQEARVKLVGLSKISDARPSQYLLLAWSVYHKLAGLSVSLGRYEEVAFRHPTARTIKNKLQYLIAEKNSVPSDLLWQTDWPIVIDNLEKAYSLLASDESAKFWGIAYLIEEHISNNFQRPVLVVCSSEIEANLTVKSLLNLYPEISRHLHPEALTVTTPGHLVNVANFSNHPVIISASSFTSRWRYLNVLLTDMANVLYPFEINQEKFFLEAQVRKISEDINNRLNCLYTLGLGEKPVSLPAATLPITYDEKYLEGERSESSYRTVNPNSIFDMPVDWDDKNLALSLDLRPDEAENQYFTAGERVRIVFENGSTIIVPKIQVLDVFRFVVEQLEEIEAYLVEKGDLIVLVEDANYLNLFDRIVEALESHPRFALVSVWLSIWNYAKEEALTKSNGEFGSLHEKLNKDGFEITFQAVRGWYNGILAPQNPDIVHQIIHYSEMPSAISKKEEIASAISHVRSLHRIVGKRLREIVKNVAVNPDENFNTKKFDEIQLAVEDIISSANLMYVKSVEILN